LRPTTPWFFHKQTLPRPVHFSVRLIEVMSVSRDGVRCTVHDGEMWMILDNKSVKIPSQLLNKSLVLRDALSVADPSTRRKVTVAAPQEWLQAWTGCYCNEEETLKCDSIEQLVHCLLVCFLFCIASAIVPPIGTHAVGLLIACRVQGATTVFKSFKDVMTSHMLC
jgi:hypothetical protein